MIGEEVLRTPVTLIVFGAGLVYLHLGLRSSRKARAKLSGKALMRTRPFALKRYNALAWSVIKDVEEVLGQKTDSSRWEGRVLIPLVVETRLRGERLFRKQKKLHRVLFPALENSIPELLSELSRVETLLRQLPRSRLSLEDVLAGRFEEATI